MQFLHAFDDIPAMIWKGLAFGAIDSILLEYLSPELSSYERLFDHGDSLVYLSIEAAIIIIVQLLRMDSLKSIEKFITFVYWYADHLLIAESVLLYAAAFFESSLCQFTKEV